MTLLENEDQIPSLENREFWSQIDNEGNKAIILFLILNKLKMSNPEGMDSDQLRSTMSELKAYSTLLNIPWLIGIYNKSKNEEIESDSLDDPSTKY